MKCIQLKKKRLNMHETKAMELKGIITIISHSVLKISPLFPQSFLKNVGNVHLWMTWTSEQYCDQYKLTDILKICLRFPERWLSIYCSSVRTGLALSKSALWKILHLFSFWNLHGSIYIGKKPYVYKHFTKAFNSSSFFNVHERIHSREKPYICNHVEKPLTVIVPIIHIKKSHTGKNFLFEINVDNNL